jgi:hypothetical protein
LRPHGIAENTACKQGGFNFWNERRNSPRLAELQSDLHALVVCAAMRFHWRWLGTQGADRSNRMLCRHGVTVDGAPALPPDPSQRIAFSAICSLPMLRSSQLLRIGDGRGEVPCKRRECHAVPRVTFPTSSPQQCQQRAQHTQQVDAQIRAGRNHLDRKYHDSNFSCSAPRRNISDITTCGFID